MRDVRTIIHLDMDAFYASVEQLDHPASRGKPVVVGADPKGGRGRGVVSACSYEARPYGIRSAMPISRAFRLCPTAVYVRPRMTRYVEMSEKIFALLSEYTDLLEPLSIDEAFLDVTASQRLFGPAADIGRMLKARVRSELGLVASIGLAPNKFLAKVGSDLGKPDGFVVVAPGAEQAFLHPLPISRLWGVGPKTEARLQQMGFRTIGQIAQTSVEALEGALGQAGRDLWDLAHGRDDRLVESAQEVKSVGAEHTFGEDTADLDVLRKTLLALADRVGRHLRQDQIVASGITLKFRDQGFHTITRAMTLDHPTDTGGEVFRAAWTLLCKVEWKGKRVRLLGVTATRLEPASQAAKGQMPLFSRAPDPKRDLDRTVDKIQERFGHEAITRASLLRSTPRRKSPGRTGEQP